MSLSDPLGDMLTRIRNGQMRGKETVLMPASRFRGNVLDVLQREGYIKGFKKLEIANNKNEFKISYINCYEIQNPILQISVFKRSKILLIEIISNIIKIIPFFYAKI